MNSSTIAKSMDNLVNTVFASFAYPGFFEPAKAFGSEYFEGSSVNTLDVLTAINNCRGMPDVDSDSDIVVDVILSSPIDLAIVDGR
jgi:predicted acylesterase/phospholipase RssA